ncbi:MAG: 2OG-Fe dioxygenase family protein [Gammaproteobacteria bacterium]|nr:2OG-Fe dioxygenase family protein [Gammaproteobacteria bacterium]
MTKNPITTNLDIRSELKENKYVTILADDFSVAPGLLDDWRRFSTDWNDLKEDDYLKNNICFRLRRFAYIYFLPDTGEILPYPPTPYFQSSELNSYAGGIERKFAPLLDSTLRNPFLHNLIKFNFRQLPVSPKKARQPWKLDVHQIRVMGTPDVAGLPTPEGIHHDENDFVCMHLISRKNAVGGVSTIYDNDRNPLESCTLSQSMDSMIVWDPQVMHGVSPILPENPGKQAIRDTLLIGYSHEPDLERPDQLAYAQTG